MIMATWRMQLPGPDMGLTWQTMFGFLGELYPQIWIQYDTVIYDMYIHAYMLDYIPFHCISLHCIVFHCIAVYFIALHCISFHLIAFHCISLHCIAICCISLHCIAFHCIALRFIRFNCIAVHYTAWHYTTTHHMTLHYVTLHHITLYSNWTKYTGQVFSLTYIYSYNICMYSVCIYLGDYTSVPTSTCRCAGTCCIACLFSVMPSTSRSIWRFPGEWWKSPRGGHWTWSKMFSRWWFDIHF